MGGGGADAPKRPATAFVPKGFLHGFVTLTPDTEVQYKCSDTYAPDCDGAVRWDPDWASTGALAIPVLSAKDAAAPPWPISTSLSFGGAA
jgi:dTDP-4-dehydrorhamnose 3,5-epimerase